MALISDSRNKKRQASDPAQGEVFIYLLILHGMLSQAQISWVQNKFTWSEFLNVLN